MRKFPVFLMVVYCVLGLTGRAAAQGDLQAIIDKAIKA